MENNQTNWIKAYIIDVLPCISISIYVLAFIYNVSFFSVFNVNIDHYLSFSEMLVNIIETLFLFVLFSVIIFWIELWWFTYYVPNFIVINTERREKKKKGKGVPYKYLRYFIRVKNSKIFTFLRKIYDWNKEKDEEYDEKYTKRKKALEKEANYHSWKSFTIFFIIILISYYIYVGLLKREYIDKGMMGASIGLSFPLLFFVLFSIIDSDMALIAQNFNKSKMKKYSAIEIVEMIILYFCFAITIFYVSGKEYGKYVKEHDIATFEIKLNDGITLSDSTYRYVNHVNDKIFLIEKETGENVILNIESTVFVRMQFKENNTNSILIEMMDMFIGKINSLFNKIERFVKKMNELDDAIF